MWEVTGLDRLAALKIAVLMGYVLAPCTAQRSHTLLSLLCTHRIAAGYFRSLPGMDFFILTVNRARGVAFPLTPRRQRISYHLLK